VQSGDGPYEPDDGQMMILVPHSGKDRRDMEFKELLSIVLSRRAFPEAGLGDLKVVTCS